MIKNPIEVFMLFVFVLAILYYIVSLNPKWRGLLALASIIMGIILTNTGFASPPKTFIPSVIGTMTNFFITVMIMTCDVRRFAKVALKPLLVFWIGAVGSVLAGTLGLLIFKGVLGPTAPAIVGIATVGTFGHSESQVAIASIYNATNALAIAYPMCNIRSLLIILISFSAYSLAPKINRWLKPTFFYKGQDVSQVEKDQVVQKPLNEANLAIVLGLTVLIMYVSSKLGPYLHIGGSGNLLLITTFGLALGTLGRKFSASLYEASHTVGLFASNLVLVFIGANSNLASVGFTFLPILAVVLMVFVIGCGIMTIAGKLLRVDWTTIIVCWLSGDVGTAAAVAATTTYGAVESVPVTVIVTMSGTVFGLYLSILLVKMWMGMM
ncbi:DUF819 family protein [Desulfitobacterium sp. AusDCA]|uniref:DUF819 family protein n=1 Tax=Desulfitobacterium sp. AusDCA TaxID=3240383 RepID=UPI003DA75CF5